MTRNAKRLSMMGALLIACSVVTIAAHAEDWNIYGWYGFTNGWKEIRTNANKRLIVQNNNFQVIAGIAKGEENPPPFSAVAQCNDGTLYGGTTVPSSLNPNLRYSEATCSDHGGVASGAVYVLE